MGWLRDGFETPAREDLPTGHHLRPIREADTDIDYPAVMGSRERLWAKYGEAWGWPPETMSYEADKEDLARHEREIAAQETFNYAVLDEARPSCSAASTSTRRTTARPPAPMPWSPGGSSTRTWGATSSARWASSCRAGCEDDVGLHRRALVPGITAARRESSSA